MEHSAIVRFGGGFRPRKSPLDYFLPSSDHDRFTPESGHQITDVRFSAVYVRYRG